MRLIPFRYLPLVVVMMMLPHTAFAGQVQLSQTGQQSCWNSAGEVVDPCTGTGQDGEKRIGAALPVTEPVTSRFVDNGNGTVTDSLNGLIWLKDGNCTDTAGGVAKSSGFLVWEDTNEPYQQYAVIWANSLANGTCGLNDGSTAGDWRLPNVNELESLINDQHPDKAGWLSTQGFVNVQSGKYWTSTTKALSPFSAWVVNMNSGVISGGIKTVDANYVWAVRGGTP